MPVPMRHSATALALCCLAPGGLAALQGPGPLITDRPDQTESAFSVPLGYVQFEAGWGFSHLESTGVQLLTHTVPQALARIGFGHGLEGRIGFAGWNRTETREAGGRTVFKGLGDVDLGLKYQIAEALGIRPHIAFMGTVTLPTGGADFGGVRADPSVRLVFANDISERVGVGYNVGATWTSVPSADGAGATKTLVDALYTVAFGFALTDRVGAFAESFGSFAVSDGAASEHLLDGGFTIMLRDNLQLDMSAGVGLNGAADDWFVGAGLSVRLPK